MSTREDLREMDELAFAWFALDATETLRHMKDGRSLSRKIREQVPGVRRFLHDVCKAKRFQDGLPFGNAVRLENALTALERALEPRSVRETIKAPPFYGDVLAYFDALRTTVGRARFGALTEADHAVLEHTIAFFDALYKCSLARLGPGWHCSGGMRP